MLACPQSVQGDDNLWLGWGTCECGHRSLSLNFLWCEEPYYFGFVSSHGTCGSTAACWPPHTFGSILGNLRLLRGHWTWWIRDLRISRMEKEMRGREVPLGVSEICTHNFRKRRITRSRNSVTNNQLVFDLYIYVSTILCINLYNERVL